VGALFEPLTLRGVTVRNRIVVSPMCEYSSADGFANEWHLVHLGSRAVGGAGLVFTEAAAVEAAGRISPQDLGIYRDEHVKNLAQIAAFIHEQGRSAVYSWRTPDAKRASRGRGKAARRLRPRRVGGVRSWRRAHCRFSPMGRSRTR